MDNVLGNNKRNKKKSLELKLLEHVAVTTFLQRNETKREKKTFHIEMKKKRHIDFYKQRHYFLYCLLNRHRTKHNKTLKRKKK